MGISRLPEVALGLGQVGLCLLAGRLSMKKPGRPGLNPPDWSHRPFNFQVSRTGWRLARGNPAASRLMGSLIELDALPPRYLPLTLDQPDDGKRRLALGKVPQGVGEID